MVSEKQKLILAFPYMDSYQTLVCNGAVRSGKTVFMTVAFIDWAMREFDGKNFAICSKTVTQCWRNVVTPYLQTTYSQKRYIINVRRAENRIEIDDQNHKNNFYIFGGKDEASYMLIQGITLAGLMLDEAPLMPQSFVNQATARCSVTGARFWMNCNPSGSKEHWFYKEWIEGAEDKKALVLNFTLDDNPSLSPDTVARYKSMYKGVFYRRYILGEWCGAEGSLFVEPPKMFSDAGLLQNGIAHIDASYGGGDYTAFTCARRQGDTIYMYGKLFEAHVDTVLDAIMADCDRLMCGPIYCETNADKGYLVKEIRRRNGKALMYAEYMNKFVKISTFGQKWWGNIQFLDQTDPKYIGQILDFTPEAEHDDACLSGDTLIATIHGDKPIAEIHEGEYVLTPAGFRRVISAGLTGMGRLTRNYYGVQSTTDHKYFDATTGEFTRADELTASSRPEELSLKGLIKWKAKLLYSTETPISEIRRANITSSTQEAIKNGNTLYSYIVPSGCSTMERYRRIITFIILMAISTITTFPTWSAYRLQNIFATMRRKTKRILSMLRNNVRISEKPRNLLKNGTKATLEKNGTNDMPLNQSEKFGRNERRECVHGVEKSMMHTSIRNFAQNNVKARKRKVESQRNSQIVSERACIAEKHSLQTRLSRNTVAHSTRLSITGNSKLQDVYNLTVEGAGCYYANGVLVSNCDSMAVCCRLLDRTAISL